MVQRLYFLGLISYFRCLLPGPTEMTKNLLRNHYGPIKDLIGTQKDPFNTIDIR